MWWNGSALPPTVQGVLMPLLPLNFEPSSFPFVLLLAPNLSAHLLVLPLAWSLPPTSLQQLPRGGAEKKKPKPSVLRMETGMERCLAGTLGANQGRVIRRRL